MLFGAVGLHPLVNMLLKEIYHRRVSLAHSLSTWDAVKVTTYHLCIIICSERADCVPEILTLRIKQFQDYILSSVTAKPL